MKRDLIYGFLAIGCVCLLLGGVFWIGSEIAEKRAAQGILTINEQRELEEARRIEKEKELEEKRKTPRHLCKQSNNKNKEKNTKRSQKTEK